MTIGIGPSRNPGEAVENPPCTCPDGVEPWEPEWDGEVATDPLCHWHGLPMTTTKDDPCDRCGGPLGPDYHDGTIAMSSTNNQRRVGTWETPAARRDGTYCFLAFCDSCYRQWHDAMKAWLAGATVRLSVPVKEAS